METRPPGPDSNDSGPFFVTDNFQSASYTIGTSRRKEVVSVGDDDIMLPVESGGTESADDLADDLAEEESD